MNPARGRKELWDGSYDFSIIDHFLEILAYRKLIALFQPIISMNAGEIIGFEGLIRGPSDSPLHAPINLFRAAELSGCLDTLEHICREVVIKSFIAQELPGRLFLNVSPECLLQPQFRKGETLSFLMKKGLDPERVVIELTESRPIYDYKLLGEAVRHYRSMGFHIAIDDLGEGFSSLRLWSELRPEFVKLDMHFIQGINQDPVKLQFVRSVQQIAENANSRVVAEGIETRAELMVIRDLGIACGQGYYIARPQAAPVRALTPEVSSALGRPGISVYPYFSRAAKQYRNSALKLLIEVDPVTPDTPKNVVFYRFLKDRQLHALPVVENGVPVGLISRYIIMERFSQPFYRELHGSKHCRDVINVNPLVVDKEISIEELSMIVAQTDHQYLSDGFILTSAGNYLGMGTGSALMREITQMQISAARYANPLTSLPGNVPINEHIERLLAGNSRFVACYCDLDHFKPFNDAYGYRRGDDIIELLGTILTETADAERDFVGHIGGDDFVVLFQSENWQKRAQFILSRFEKAALEFFPPSARARGGYTTLDRDGEQMFFPLTSLSIGAVVVDPQPGLSHHDISAAMASAKKQAKRSVGNSLFIERRKTNMPLYCAVAPGNLLKNRALERGCE